MSSKTRLGRSSQTCGLQLGASALGHPDPGPGHHYDPGVRGNPGVHGDDHHHHGDEDDHPATATPTRHPCPDRSPNSGQLFAGLTNVLSSGSLRQAPINRAAGVCAGPNETRGGSAAGLMNRAARSLPQALMNRAAGSLRQAA